MALTSGVLIHPRLVDCQAFHSDMHLASTLSRGSINVSDHLSATRLEFKNQGPYLSPQMYSYSRLIIGLSARLNLKSNKIILIIYTYSSAE